MEKNSLFVKRRDATLFCLERYPSAREEMNGCLVGAGSLQDFFRLSTPTGIQMMMTAR